MSQTLLLFGIGVLAFVSTNVDDLFILLAFFSLPGFSARQVVLGQFLGMGAIIALSLLGSTAKWVIAPDAIRWLGLVPLLIGLKKLRHTWRGTFQSGQSGEIRASSLKQRSGDRAGVVAWIILANGGDNLGIYIPLFSSYSRREVTGLVVLFGVMTALWCSFAWYLASHRKVAAPIRKLEPILMPWLLLGLGFYILFK